MRCSKCGSYDQGNSRFCINCGAPIIAQATTALSPAPSAHQGDPGQTAATMSQVLCPHCGRGNEPGARFCIWCGQPVQLQSQPSSSQTLATAPTPTDSLSGQDQAAGAQPQLLCPHCQGPNEPAGRFCIWCRHPLQPMAQPPEAQPTPPPRTATPVNRASPARKPRVKKRRASRALALVAVLGALALVMFFVVGRLADLRLPAGGTQGGTQEQPIQVQIKELESSHAAISGDQGGSISLANGARLDVAASALDSDTDLRLVRSAAPSNIPGGDVLQGDVYYALSSKRPLVKGDTTLAIPYDKSKLPPDVSEGSLQVYGLISNIMYPVDSRVDTTRQVLIVERPDVSVSETKSGRSLLSSNLFRSINARPLLSVSSATGYIYGSPIKAPAPNSPNEVKNLVESHRTRTCQSARHGEIHEEPGHVFRLFFNTNSNCAVARKVSGWLMEAYNIYNKEYTDAEGKAPLAYFTPQRRLNVFLGDTGDNAEFQAKFTYDGYMNVNIAVGARNESDLRFTLYHELFHAVQDRYKNIWLASGLANSTWWMEASAEWAAIHHLNMDFGAAVRDQLTRHKHLLKVNPRHTDRLEAYAYSLLIDFVERRKPGYVRAALTNSLVSGDAYYDDMVSAAQLGQTYPEFVREVLSHAFPVVEMRSEGHIVEQPNRTVVYRIEGEDPIAGLRQAAIITDQSQRAGPHHLRAPSSHLTTRLFDVMAFNLTQPKDVEVKLRSATAGYELLPSDSAWLVTVPRGGPPSFTRLSAEGTTVRGLGGSVEKLWIALFVADPDWTRNDFNNEVEITLKDAAAIDLCSLFPSNPDLVPSPLNDPAVMCSVSTSDHAVEYLTVTSLSDPATARLYVDTIRKNYLKAEPTTEYGEAGYAYNLGAEKYRSSAFPGHGIMFARGRYVVAGHAGFDTSTDPPTPISPDRLRALAKHVDQQLRNRP